jgi:hypothetical protein
MNHLRSNVVAYIALFFALSAGAYAAGLAPNSVKSKHIKDGQVTGADVEDNGLTGEDLLESSFDTSTFPEGPQGPPGEDGDQGPPGEDGDDGSPDTAAQVLAKLLTVDGPGSSLDADTLDGLSATAFLGAGDTATNSDKLDGLDAADFGRVTSRTLTLTAPYEMGQQTIVTDDEFMKIDGLGRFEAWCSNANGSTLRHMKWRNTSGRDQFVFTGSTGDRVANNGTRQFESGRAEFLIVDSASQLVATADMGVIGTGTAGQCVFTGQVVTSD